MSKIKEGQRIMNESQTSGDDEEYISTDDAAEIIGVHKYTLLRWIHKNKKDATYICPPYWRMGYHFKFKVSEIKDFIKNSRSRRI